MRIVRYRFVLRPRRDQEFTSILTTPAVSLTQSWQIQSPELTIRSFLYRYNGQHNISHMSHDYDDNSICYLFPDPRAHASIRNCIRQPHDPSDTLSDFKSCYMQGFAPHPRKPHGHCKQSCTTSESQSVSLARLPSHTDVEITLDARDRRRERKSYEGRAI